MELKKLFFAQNNTIWVEMNGLLDALFAEHKTTVYQFKKPIEDAQQRDIQSGLTAPLSNDNSQNQPKKQAKCAFLSVGEGFKIIKDYVPQQTRAKLQQYEQLVRAQFWYAIVAELCAEYAQLKTNPKDFLFDLSLWEIKKSNEELQAEIAALQQQSLELKSQINERDFAIDQLQVACTELQQQINNNATTTADLQNVNSLLSAAIAEKNELQSINATLQNQISATNAVLESRLQELQSYCDSQQKNDAVIAELEAQLQSSSSANAALEADINRLNSQFHSAESDLLHLRKTMRETSDKLACATEENENLALEIQDLTASNLQFQQIASSAESELQDFALIKKQLAAAQKNVAELQAQLTAKSSMRGWLTSPDASLWVTIAVCIIFLPFSYLSITKYIQIGDTSSWAFAAIAFGMAAIWDFSILYFAINGKTALAKFGMLVQTVFLAAKFDYIIHLCTSIGISYESASQTQLIVVISAIVFYTPKLVHSLTTLASASQK